MSGKSKKSWAVCGRHSQGLWVAMNQTFLGQSSKQGSRGTCLLGHQSPQDAVGRLLGDEGCLDSSSQALPYTKTPMSVEHLIGTADTLTCLKVRGNHACQTAFSLIAPFWPCIFWDQRCENFLPSLIPEGRRPLPRICDSPTTTQREPSLCESRYSTSLLKRWELTQFPSFSTHAGVSPVSAFTPSPSLPRALPPLATSGAWPRACVY